MEIFLKLCKIVSVTADINITLLEIFYDMWTCSFDQIKSFNEHYLIWSITLCKGEIPFLFIHFVHGCETGRVKFQPSLATEGTDSAHTDSLQPNFIKV